MDMGKEKCDSFAMTFSFNVNPVEPPGDFGLLCYTALLTAIIKTPNKGNIFGRMMFHPSSRVPETWKIKTHFMLHFSFICHPSINLFEMPLGFYSTL